MNRAMTAESGKLFAGTAHSAIPLHIAKEIRIGLPAWGMTCLAPTAALALGWQGAALTEETTLVTAGALYALGAAILAANSFGVEFSQRTMPLLLAQPISRLRIFAIKTGVLAFFLATSILPLAYCTSFLGSINPFELLSPSVSVFKVAIVVAALNAFCAGPCLALLTRSALGGAVFSMAGFLVLCLSGNLIGFQLPFAFAHASVGRASSILAALWGGTLLLAWTEFRALEEGESAGADLTRSHGRTWGIGAGLRRVSRSWWHQLVVKELRLQRVPFLLTGLFCACWLIFSLLVEQRSDVLAFLPQWVVMYTLLVCLAAGALTSAEERELGTHEWHLLVPVSARTQWLIKVATALAVALGLGAAFPWLLLNVPRWEGLPKEALGTSFLFGLSKLALLVTVAAIYASSISGTTVSAVIGTLVVSAGIWASEAAETGLLREPAWCAALLLLLLWFGFLNFRRAGPKVRRGVGRWLTP